VPRQRDVAGAAARERGVSRETFPIGAAWRSSKHRMIEAERGGEVPILGVERAIDQLF
jgi:hypothetical protein